MSNTRKAKWTAAQITAANAEHELRQAALAIAVDAITEDPSINPAAAAHAVRTVLGERLLADIAAHGHGPAAVAAAEQQLMALDTGFWLQLGQEVGILGPQQ